MNKKPRKRRKPEVVKIGNMRIPIYRREKLIKSKNKDGSITERTYTVYEVADSRSGVRKLISFADHAEAVKEAEKIAGGQSTAKAIAAGMTNEQAASYGRSVQLLPAGVSLEIACAVYAKCWNILGGDKHIEAANFYKQHRVDQIVHKTVAEVVTELIALKRKRTKRGRAASDRYVGDLSARLTRFAEDFAVDIDTITTPDVQRWIDDLEVAPQTAKNFLTVIGTLFAFAEARGYIMKGGNPVDGVETINANGGAIEIYSADEMVKLLRSASPEFRLVMLLGAFAGLRTAEIERLEATDIADGFITVAADKAKTRSRRIVPIQPNLAAWLGEYKLSGKIWKGTSNDLQDARAVAVAGSGVAWKDNGCRHSFISNRLAIMQDENKVAMEAGNSPKVIFRHYRELVKPAAADAWFAVGPQSMKETTQQGTP